MGGKKKVQRIKGRGQKDTSRVKLKTAKGISLRIGMSKLKLRGDLQFHWSWVVILNINKNRKQ